MSRPRIGDRAGVRSKVIGTAAGAVREGLHQLVRRNLRGVWVRGELPTGPAVWASNHHGWWDYFAAVAALRAVGRRDVGVLMDAANIANAELYRQVGAIGAHQLRTALALLADGAVVVVFPEGELRAAGGLGPLRPGASWLADRAAVALLPVATRVILRGQQAPEAYLDIAAPVGPGDELEPLLATRLQALDDDLAAAPPEQPLPGFTLLVPGVRSWNERFTRSRDRV